MRIQMIFIGVAVLTASAMANVGPSYLTDAEREGLRGCMDSASSLYALVEVADSSISNPFDATYDRLVVARKAACKSVYTMQNTSGKCGYNDTNYPNGETYNGTFGLNIRLDGKKVGRIPAVYYKGTVPEGGTRFESVYPISETTCSLVGSDNMTSWFHKVCLNTAAVRRSDKPETMLP